MLMIFSVFAMQHKHLRKKGLNRTRTVTSVMQNVCPVIDHEFRHNIVKVAVDPQTTLTML